jgi:peptidoglycan/LPS O-acetylase OafA/YrhL
MIVEFTLTFLVASTSFYLLEQPILKLKDRFVSVSDKTAALAPKPLHQGLG